MTLQYPLDTPDTIGIESITLQAINAVAQTKSPYSFQTQVYNWGGERWGAEVTIPTVRRDLAADWKAFLTALRGQTGTFLLGDPDYATPRGSVTAVDMLGSKGEDVITIDSMTGNFEAGDYFQMLNGSAARLYMILEQTSGTGDYSVWPRLREDYTISDTVILTNPKGVFKLTEASSRWTINNNSQYAISFQAEEKL